MTEWKKTARRDFMFLLEQIPDAEKYTNMYKRGYLTIDDWFDAIYQSYQEEKDRQDLERHIRENTPIE